MDILMISWYKTIDEIPYDLRVNVLTGECIHYHEIEDELETNNNFIYLVCDPISMYMEDLADQIGISELLDYAKNHIVNYLKDEFDLSKRPFSKWLNRNSKEEQTYGEFFLIYNTVSYRCNNPMDPEEWDVETTCEGILGYNLNLVSKNININ